MIRKILNLEKNDKTMFLMLFVTGGNILLALVKYIFAFMLPSLWFFVNALFMTVLSVSRFFSIRDYGKIRNNKESIVVGYKNYLNNGVLLILLGIMYFFVSVYMYYKGTNTNMHEYLTYLVALSAFWSIGWAIYGMIKYKRKDSPILKGVKITNFCNALTSIVLTQVVLLDTYAADLDLSQVNGYTGMGVSLIIMGLGLYMIINIRKFIEE